MRLGDLDALKKKLNFVYDCSYIESKSKEGIASDIIDEIDNAPTVEPTFGLFKEMLCSECGKRPQGNWIVKEGVVSCYTACNKCGYADYNHKRSNYCPNCGAEMKGGAE